MTATRAVGRSLVTCLFLGFPLFSSGHGNHDPSLTESLSRTSIRSPQVSPDGHLVAYLQRETDWKENEFVWQLWLADVDSGRVVQLTRGKKSAGPAEWSPDGNWLAFATEREMHSIEAPSGEQKPDTADSNKPAAKQIWLIAPTGGEAWPLTKSEADVEEVHWSKDGKFILFTAAEAPSKAAKARREHYSAYDVVEKDFQQQQLWRVSADAGIQAKKPQTATQLTFDRTLNVSSFAISPDSARVAFSARKNPLLAFLKDEDIYLLTLPN